MRGTKPRLIIADDSALRHARLQEQVQFDHHIVASVVEGRAAIEAVQQLRPALVLRDTSMPILNGFEAARQIQQLELSGRLLFVSELRSLDYREAAFQAGGSGYGLKEQNDSRTGASYPRRVSRQRVWTTVVFDLPGLPAYFFPLFRTDQASAERRPVLGFIEEIATTF